MENFRVNELIIYQNGPKFEIGRIKSLREDGAFVWYHSGYTAAFTSYALMHKLSNAYYINSTSLGELAEEGD